MNNQIDARRKTCPIPVVMAKKEVDSRNEKFSVLVDNLTAVENLKRFGASNGYEIAVREMGPDFKVDFTKAGNLVGDISEESVVDSCDMRTPFPGNKGRAVGYPSWAVFITKEMIGDGDPELGGSLLKMFVYTLTQDDKIPKYMLFMNAGVKIPVENEQIIEHLRVLEEKGTQILICGTCLNFYGIADQLKAGTVSNMYDIADAMKSVDKVITI